jgi:hypothetical protein
MGKTQKNYLKNSRFSGFSTVFQQPVRFFFFTGFFPCGTRLFSTFSTACFLCFHRVIFEFSTGVEKLVENFCRSFAFPTIKENKKKRRERISRSAEREEAFAASTAPPFEKGGRKLSSFWQYQYLCQQTEK